MSLIFDLVKTKSIRVNTPIGKVKYRKFKGTNTILLKATSPTACFLANSKSVVNPKIPKVLTEK